jgi:hypothetical protein
MGKYFQKISIITLFIFTFAITSLAQTKFYEPYLNTVDEFSIKDFGKMWTFDAIPYDYFKSEYNFIPSKEWLNRVQKSALQFGGGCSGAFVSEDGLIMTNHHCGRGGIVKVEEQNEDFLKTGFYAENLEAERKVPGLYADQLIFIEDVTKEIISEIGMADSLFDKAKLIEKKIDSTEENFSVKTGLLCKVVTLFNGGKYFVYGYKRYYDIRLVMAPEFQIASTGWDWDNFTFPRYELDFAFFRAYENDKPVKTENYFLWSKEGAVENEPIFVVGRPGNTDRLLSVEELKFKRDNIYPKRLKLLNGIYNSYRKMFEKYPEKESLYLNGVMQFGNSRKVYAGMIAGLKDEANITRKHLFKEQIRKKIADSEKLSDRYNLLNKSIKKNLDELAIVEDSLAAFKIYSSAKPVYLKIAELSLKLANQLELPEEQREEPYTGEYLNAAIEGIYPPEIDTEFQKYLLDEYLSYLQFVLHDSHSLLNMINPLERIYNNSELTTPEKFKNFIKKEPKEILNSSDPFIVIVNEGLKAEEKFNERKDKLEAELKILNQQLGEFIFNIYGNQIPPDATSTLRISDGMIKGYEYNGTISPAHTTFFGMYDRYYSFGKNTYPWGLPEKWVDAHSEINLSTPLNFVSTNDIVGGNSGSSAINKQGEVVGLIFDGNMESLEGNFIYQPELNRAIGVDSKAIIEALKKVYKTESLVDELLSGKL